MTHLLPTTGQDVVKLLVLGDLDGDWPFGFALHVLAVQPIEPAGLVGMLGVVEVAAV